MTGIIVKLVGMFLATFAPNYALFVIGRCLAGTGNTFSGLTQFVLCMYLHSLSSK